MLINEILDLSRVEAGRYELKEESVSLVDDASRIAGIYSRIRAQKREIEIIEMTSSRTCRASGPTNAPCGRSC